MTTNENLANAFSNDVRQLTLTGGEYKGIALENSNFGEGVNLSESTFIDGVFTDVSFSEGNLSEVEFKGSRFTNTSFADANLGVSAFDNCTFQGFMDLHGANLQESTWTNVHTESVNSMSFIGTCLEYAAIQRMAFKAASLQFAKCGSVTMSNVYFSGADLTEADLSNSELYRVEFDTCVLRKTGFYNAEFNQSQFKNCTLQEIDFRSTKLHQTDFTGAVIIDCDFRGADLTRTYFNRAIMVGCVFDCAKFDETLLAGARIFPGTSFKNCTGLETMPVRLDAEGRSVL